MKEKNETLPLWIKRSVFVYNRNIEYLFVNTTPKINSSEKVKRHKTEQKKLYHAVKHHHAPSNNFKY